MAIWLSTQLRRRFERAGCITGLNRPGAFTMPTNVAASAVFRSLGFLLKKVLAAVLIPNELEPYSTVFKYMRMISRLV